MLNLLRYLYRRLDEFLNRPCPGRAPNIPCLWCDCPRLSEYHTEETRRALAERKR